MALQAASEARDGLLVPRANAAEAAVVEGLNVYPVGSLAEAVGFLTGQVDRGQVKGDSHQIWRTQREQVNLASLRLFLRSSTGPNRAFEPQSLGRVLDPVRIAEGPTHDFGLSILGFGLRTETTRVSSPQAPARGEEFLVDSLREGERTGPPTL